MSFKNFFGIDSKEIISQNLKATGTITKVSTCWWLKVNTKAVRSGPFDGAEFPHIIHFTYEASGVKYSGKRWLSHSAHAPGIGEKITVYYDGKDAANYAVYAV